MRLIIGGSIFLRHAAQCLVMPAWMLEGVLVQNATNDLGPRT